MANLTDICAECRNYFLPDYINLANSIHRGTYTISDGTVSDTSFLLQGQYFRIVGSVLNVGVYENTAEGRASLRDETFTGSIWAMAVPPDFIRLANDIEAWQEKNESIDSKNLSPFSSENISGVYGYSKGGSNSNGGTAVPWQAQFGARLKRYKRVYEL